MINDRLHPQNISEIIVRVKEYLQCLFTPFGLLAKEN